MRNPPRPLDIRAVQPTDSDYNAWLQVRNAVWDDEPMPLDQLKYEDAVWPADYFSQRLLVSAEDQVVAVTHIFENHWQYQPGKYDLEILVHPDFQKRGIGSWLFDFLLQELRKRTPEPTSLVSGTRDDRTHALAFLEKRGYEVIMNWARSRLDLEIFDWKRFGDAIPHVERQGIHIYSIQELAAKEQDWQRKFYEMDLVASQDAPSPDPMSETSLEKFVENTFNTPRFIPEGTFIAINSADGQWLASTELARFADHSCMYTPFTCVHPDFRRLGIATAIKVSAIQFAQEQGVKSILAANEENNPMYQINLMLGFKPLPKGLTMKKLL